MKKVLLFAVCIIFLAGAAFGQAGYIGLFFDAPGEFAGYTDRCYDDVDPALVPVYVVHKWTPGATASQFIVVSGGGFNCTYTGEVIHIYVSIGATHSGLSASYGGCLASDILIATINYFCSGTSPACAYLEVVPDPLAITGTIEVYDCSFVKLVGFGSTAYFNHPGVCDYPCVVPTKQTNWGQVKAL